MKKTIIFILTIFSLFGQTPVYFNIISHNESSDPLDYDGNFSDYSTILPMIKELCDTVISKKAKYNMQVDANFIKGVLTWDNGASNSNDILEWANNSPYIDVDGHNHFVLTPGPSYNPYNYSDLAYLLDSCGVTLGHKILGGVNYADTVIGSIVIEENWTQYSVPCPGYTYTNFYWQADVVWGTATPGHIADYTRFGIWKPQGASSPSVFGTHDPNASVTHIGGGCKEEVGYIIAPQTGQLVRTTDEVITNIKNIVDAIQTIPPSPNDFYTLNMLINFRDIPNIPSFADSIGKIIDGIQGYVNQGKIIWATLGEKYDIWYANHSNPNDYFNYDCQKVITPVTHLNENMQIYPGLTSQKIFFKNFRGTFSVRIINSQGKEVFFSGNFQGKDMDVSFLKSGFYALIVETSSQITVHKFIRQ